MALPTRSAVLHIRFQMLFRPETVPGLERVQKGRADVKSGRIFSPLTSSFLHEYAGLHH